MHFNKKSSFLGIVRMPEALYFCSQFESIIDNKKN